MTKGITMTNAIIESIVSRSTTKKYDPAVTLSDDQIRELVRIATTAPTSFHLQNWRFIAYARLKPRLGCVRSPGITPWSPMQPLPSSSAASWPITA
jgi:nitroreductase